MIYEGLPIYKATYDFLLAVFIFSKAFSREYKYTIGQELKNETIQLILHIYRANSSQKDRFLLLENAKTHLETVRLLLRLIKDLKQVSVQDFSSLSLQIENISKQLSGWQQKSIKA